MTDYNFTRREEKFFNTLDDDVFIRSGSGRIIGDDYSHPRAEPIIVIGSTANDTVYTDSELLYRGNACGDDTVMTGKGHDLIFGDIGLISSSQTVRFGNDWIDAGSGNDTVYGDSKFLRNNDGGDDTIIAWQGADFVFGDGEFGNQKGGDDFIDGRAHNDILFGDYRNETGEGGNDTILGGRGQDLLVGGGGDDILNGQQHVDLLYGGSGDDILTGGGGNSGKKYQDFFMFNFDDETGHDTITDFDPFTDEFVDISGHFDDYNDLLNYAVQDGEDILLTDKSGNSSVRFENLDMDQFSSFDHYSHFFWSPPSLAGLDVNDFILG